MKIGIVIVCYNPDIRTDKLIDNISNDNNYEKIVIVDNSNFRNKKFENLDRKKFKYIPNCKNLGIAKAQNIGLDYLNSIGLKWAITLDQDTIITYSLSNKYIKYLDKKEKLDDIGIISTNYYDIGTQKQKFVFNESEILVDETISSGSLINIDIFNKIGKMREDYFIDQVDNEYCLRLKVNGYKIVILNGIDMEHKIGKIELRKIFGREICIYHQSPMRYYYRTRNLLFMIKDYKDRAVIIKVIKSLVKDFIKLLYSWYMILL